MIESTIGQFVHLQQTERQNDRTDVIFLSQFRNLLMDKADSPSQHALEEIKSNSYIKQVFRESRL